MEAGALACTRIGGPLLFGRLWDRLGLGEVVKELLDGRGFGFDVERAVFVSVLHRLFVSGSDRSCEKWMADYALEGVEDRAGGRGALAIGSDQSPPVSGPGDG